MLYGVAHCLGTAHLQVCGLTYIVWKFCWVCSITSFLLIVHFLYFYFPKFVLFGFGLVWYVLVWFGLVWYGMVWFGLVWYGLVWFGMVWYGLVWYGMVWFGRLAKRTYPY